MSEMKAIEPDDFDLQFARYRGLLMACPFCGCDPLVHNCVREEGTFSGQPVYRSTVSCIGDDCMATVGYNARSKEEARTGAIERWSRRAAPLKEST